MGYGQADQIDREMMALALGQARVSLEEGGVPVGAVLAAGVAQAGDLAVRHRVTLLHPLVVPGRDQLASLARTARGQHRPDRHPAGFQAGPGLAEGQRDHLSVVLICVPVSHAG